MSDQKFQSPSLRGSGRFPVRRRGASQAPSGFNPLHCGAVVASLRRALPALDPERGFNPLHCGAVVASEVFDRPQCRIVACFNPLHCGAVVASRGPSPSVSSSALLFQSPSLRGSGRFIDRR